MALASHLKQIDAKFYGAYWCSYCKKQKELFGQEAFRQIDYVECDPAGKDARPELCQKAHIEGFPTWEIKGQLYPGMQSLQQLADISGYKDDRELKNWSSIVLQQIPMAWTRGTCPKGLLFVVIKIN